MLIIIKIPYIFYNFMKITLADLKNRALIVSLIPINRQMICERDWQRATVAPAMRGDATRRDLARRSN